MAKARQWILALTLGIATIAAGYSYHAVNAQSGGSSGNSEVIGDGHPLP